MLTAQYYEKNNGYKYVLDTLEEQLGEETTVSIVDEAVKKCNAFCREYAGLPKKEKVHTDKRTFVSAAHKNGGSAFTCWTFQPHAVLWLQSSPH